MPEPPCTASPAGLFSTSTSSSSYSVISLSCCRVWFSASESWPAAFGASSCSGGMRTLCPASSRSLLSARLPFTRNSPLRTMRWMWENDRPRKPRLEKTVDPHVVLVRRHHDGLDLCRQRRRLARASQAARGLSAACPRAGRGKPRRRVCRPDDAPAAARLASPDRDARPSVDPRRAEGLLMRRLMRFFQSCVISSGRHDVATPRSSCRPGFPRAATRRAAANSSRIADWCQTSARAATPCRP